MRTKPVVFVLFLVLVIGVNAAVTGQEGPFVAAAPTIFLAVEPVHETAPPTLADAARRNDYATLHVLYEKTRPAEYATLHELWTWALSDPIGAFYGPDTYARLSRAYPGFAAYIAEYRIVDGRGNVFYPTSETRAFLLERAAAKESPRVRIAEATAPVRGSEAAPASARRTESRRSTTTAETPASAPARSTASRRRGTATSSAAATATSDRARSATTAVPQAEVDPAVAETAPVAVPAPAAIRTTPLITRTEVPPPAAPQTAPVKGNSNGILLLIVGLIGVGVLAMLLRTPREAPGSILPAQPAETPAGKAAAPVEPIRLAEPAAEPPKARVTGSRG